MILVNKHGKKLQINTFEPLEKIQFFNSGNFFPLRNEKTFTDSNFRQAILTK
jgi:hypothetical protein